MTNEIREQRMTELMSGLPQNRGVDWDAVMPVIEFTFSSHADPVKARRAEYQESDEDFEASKKANWVLWLQVC